MPNISGSRVAVCFFLFLMFVQGSNLYAADSAKAVIEEFFHTSKPVVDPESFKAPAAPADPFLQKQNQKKQKFLKKQHQKRRKFSAEMAGKQMEPLLREQEIRKFERKQFEQTQKFLLKQKEKSDKHFSKGG